MRNELIAARLIVTASPELKRPSLSITDQVSSLSSTTNVRPTLSELTIEMCAAIDFGPRSAVCSVAAVNPKFFGSEAIAGADTGA